MAKKVTKLNSMIVDRVLLLGLLLAATAYIVRGHWAATLFAAAAFVLGIIWCFRAITTNPSAKFRMVAMILLALIGALLACYLGGAKSLY